jgi:hypothetical protein
VELLDTFFLTRTRRLIDSVDECDWEANRVGNHSRDKPYHYYDTACQAGAVVSW